MNDFTAIADTIRHFIIDTFQADDGSGNLGNEFPLMGAGVIDSVSMLMLINFIEETFGISFEIDEIARERFNTIDSIARLVQEKAKRIP